MLSDIALSTLSQLGLGSSRTTSNGGIKISDVVIMDVVEMVPERTQKL